MSVVLFVFPWEQEDANVSDKSALLACVFQANLSGYLYLFVFWLNPW
uniref:Uncharacterized protein n=1 Tax=Arundo donax TaxID=35708 RepID=A0A0A9CI23_ARUDO